MYAIDDTVRGQPPDARRRVRQAQALPRLLDFKQWMDKTLAATSAKSDLAKAILYASRRWNALMTPHQATIVNAVQTTRLRL